MAVPLAPLLRSKNAPTEADASQSHAHGKRHVPLKHVVPVRRFLPKFCKEEAAMRLFVVALALAVAASTQAVAFGSHGRMTNKAEVNEGYAPRISTVEQEGLVCKAMAPECTIPIRTGRRATTRKARKFPRAVAISQRRLGSSSPTAARSDRNPCGRKLDC